MDHPDKDTIWYQPGLDVFLNRWYSSYADAQSAREKQADFYCLTKTTSLFVNQM